LPRELVSEHGRTRTRADDHDVGLHRVAVDLLRSLRDERDAVALPRLGKLLLPRLAGRAFGHPLGIRRIADGLVRPAVVVVADVAELLPEADHRLHPAPPELRHEAQRDIAIKSLLDEGEPLGAP